MKLISESWRRKTGSGRHRAESRLGPVIVIGTVVALLWVAIMAVFLLQQPQALTKPVRAPVPSPSSYGPIPQAVPSAAVPAPVRAYQAAKGDSIWKISLRECGNANDWRHLASANHISWPWTVGIGEVITLDCAG